MGAIKELIDSITTLRSSAKEAVSEIKKDAAKSALYMAQKSMRKKREERLRQLAYKAKRFDRRLILTWLDEKSTNQIKGVRLFKVEEEEEIRFHVKCTKRDKDMNFIELIDNTTGYCVATVIESSNDRALIYNVYEMNKERTAVIKRYRDRPTYTMRFENGDFCEIDKSKEKERKILFLKRECARVKLDKLPPTKYVGFIDFNANVEDKYLIILMAIYNIT